MGKRVDTSDLDTAYVIMQAKPSNRAKELKPYDPSAFTPAGKTEPLAETLPVAITPPAAEPVVEAELPHEAKETSRRRRGQAVNYRETFLRRNEMKMRQCVYISYDIHLVIAKLVRALVSAGNDISVGGYIDTVLSEHLHTHREEINEAYRQHQGDLL